MLANSFRYYFIPLPGCFSPFPHGTSSLSVAKEYLDLWGGPHRFTPIFSVSALLGITCEGCVRFEYGAITHYGRPFQSRSPTQQLGNSVRGLVPSLFGPTTPRLQRHQAWHSHGLVSTLFARRYSGCRGCFPFLTVLRCFNSRGSLHRCYVFTPGYTLHDEWWVSPFGHLRIEA